MTSPDRRRTIRPWMIATLVALVVLVLAALNVKVVSTADVEAAAAGGFDPIVFADENFDEISGYVDENAVELPALLTDLAGGADESDFGNTSGASSAFAFPVTFTAVAGTLTEPVLPVTVEGVPAEVTVQVQVGPAINGTALRDVSGTISFNQFTNQLEYQNVGTELNNLARERVLTDFDAAAAAGKTIQVTGAFLRVNPNLVSVVPTAIEVVE